MGVPPADVCQTRDRTPETLQDVAAPCLHVIMVLRGITAAQISSRPPTWNLQAVLFWRKIARPCKVSCWWMGDTASLAVWCVLHMLVCLPRTFSLSVWLVCAAEFLRGVSFSAIFAIFAPMGCTPAFTEAATSDPKFGTWGIAGERERDGACSLRTVHLSPERGTSRGCLLPTSTT